MKEGDQNTKFFHCMATTRKKKNKLEKLKDSVGNWCYNRGDLDSLIMDYLLSYSLVGELMMLRCVG